MPKDRDDDSGLHDIRSLASSTKARLSSRRSTVNPVMREEDVLASTSAGWKAVALPEPARMVSLPELTSLPSKAEIEAQDRAARQALKADAKAAPAVGGAPASEAPELPSFGARIAAQQSGRKNKTIALVGIGLAAAAGVGLFVMSGGDHGAAAPAAAPTARASTELPTMTAKQLPPPAASAPAPTEAAAVVAVAEPPPAAPEPAKVDAKPTKAKDDKDDKVHRVEIRDTMAKAEAPAKPEDKPKDAPKGGADGEEPSFDALLKEAGVDGPKKDAKVVLDKKSLSGGDIKAGMGGVAGKAQACYAGTQGTASVKLTVAPSGQVQKVSVGGAFAGTPVAACVEAAVKSATFPPWDGGPQTFSYSYLLAE